MEDLIQKPAPVLEAAEKQKGLNWFVEILVFIAVFMAVSIAQLIIMLPGEIILSSTDSEYQAAISAGNKNEIMEAGEKLVASDAYMIISLFSTIAMILVVCAFCRLFQKRSLYSIGFSKTNILKEYIIGIIAGFLFFSAAVMLGVLTGGLSITGFVPGFSVGIFILYLLGFMVQGMAEEVLCRGYMMVSVARKYNMVVAILCNSLFFAMLHLFNNGISVLAFLNLSLFGIFASLYFIRRGNIWGIGAFHSMWNLVQGCFYGISVSGMNSLNSLLKTESVKGKDLLNGGSFGMEASIWVTAVLLAGIAFLFFMKNKNPDIRKQEMSGI